MAQSLAASRSAASSRSPALGPRTFHESGQRNLGRWRSRSMVVLAMAPQKKVNRYDDKWSKQWFGAGIFNEDSETAPVNIITKLEKNKLLSKVEKAGLLSKAENAGITLSQIERLGLLSKAEDLGLLSFAENFASTSPATLASLSLPCLVAALATILLVPDESTTLVVVQNVVAVLFAVAAGGLFLSSIVLQGLQEE